MKDYRKVTEKAVTLFRNNEPEGSRKPKWSNGTVNISTDLPAGRYSIGVWEWADSGNLTIDIQQVIERDDEDHGEFR